MGDTISIGAVPWSHADIRNKLEEFASLYVSRPIRDNTGGMGFPHMFAAWFILSTLSPRVIIESGVFHGQGTWLFEQACPQARLYCIDINLSQVQYRAKNAMYLADDFSTIDWSHLPMEDTVCFFDDHQNAYERTKTAAWFGFRDLIFEDNYPPLQGDCYSLKKAFMGAGFFQSAGDVPKRTLLDRLRRRRDNAQQSVWEVAPSQIDATYLRRNLEIYYEFPPIYRCERTRWDDLWDEINYPTPTALLEAHEDFSRFYPEEMNRYTWMCYVRIKA